MAWIGHFHCDTSVHPFRSRLSVFDIVYRVIILLLCWNVTGGSTIKGEREVEYVSAEALKSICLWTDGLINRQWLEQMVSSCCFSLKSVRRVEDLQKQLAKTSVNASFNLNQCPPALNSFWKDWQISSDGLWRARVSFAFCSYAVPILCLLREATTLRPHINCCRPHTPGGCILLNVKYLNWYDGVSCGQKL